MKTAQDILTVATVYAEAQSLKLTTLSARVFDDSKKLAQIADGADITLARAGAALRWFSDRWPEGLAWPADIWRPDPTPSSEGAAA